MRTPFLRSAAAAAAASLVFTAAGCGGSAEGQGTGENAPVVEQQANQSVEKVKAVLQTIANTGDVNYSELYGLDESLKAMGKPELVDDLNKVAQAKGEKAKTLANELIGKL